MIYPKAVAALIEQFQKFPSVGPKSAQRMAFYLLRMPLSEVQNIAKSMIEAKENTRTCEVCFNLSSASPCEICSSSSRDRSTICVVAETKDLIAVEKTNEYRGLYHVLQGLISPMDGINPEDIGLEKLIDRIQNGNFTEVVFAFNPSIEAETTSMYIKRILSDTNIKFTRLASGVPMGANMEYIDSLTLERALSDRKEVE